MSCAPAADGPRLNLPARPDRAAGATAIVEAIRDVDLRRREQTIYEQVTTGNVPESLRRLEPVVMTGTVDGEDHSITFWVTPDYLSVGSDDDHILIAVTASTARRIAAAAGASLPTARMVDAIWMAADERIPPIRIEPDDERGSMRYIERHHNLISAQRDLHRVAPDAFVAGHKVDLVLAPDAGSKGEAGSSDESGNATVYGWHQSDGRPIQALFTSPSDSMVVFNHGVRLVHGTVLVDGEERDLDAVLGDAVLGSILRGESRPAPRPDPD